jgi:hypothetical protein
VDEALDLVKRSHGVMQAATLNSVARALAPHNVARALRLVSFMTTLGLPTFHQTSVALIGACARQHHLAAAHDLYWCAAAAQQTCLLLSGNAGVLVDVSAFASQFLTH